VAGIPVRDVDTDTDSSNESDDRTIAQPEEGTHSSVQANLTSSGDGG
jgi:hypothetical protein